MDNNMSSDTDSIIDPLSTLKPEDELDNIFSKVDNVPPSINPSILDKPVIPDSDGLKETTIPKLRGSEFPKEFQDIVDRINLQYSYLPKINYDDTYKELGDLSVKTNPTPNLETLNDELQKIQAAKDRLSEIYINVVQSYNFKARAVDILTDAWGKFTSEKNADSRKGDAAYRLSNFAIDLANTESLIKVCMHILKTMDGAQDNLSRRITVYQMIMKNDIYTRGGLPDNDFEKSLNKKEQKLSEEGDLPLENF